MSYTLLILCLEPKTVKEWKQVLESPRVVATTCMGVSHVVFSKRRFDLVGWCRIYFPFGLAHFVIVVDEAGQIAEPVCIGPLRMAKRSFVLVGDPYQLPPLMRVSKWKDSVQSLFERLCLVGYILCSSRIRNNTSNSRNIQKQLLLYVNSTEWPTISCNFAINLSILNNYNVQMNKLLANVLQSLQVPYSLYTPQHAAHKTN